MGSLRSAFYIMKENIIGRKAPKASVPILKGGMEIGYRLRALRESFFYSGFSLSAYFYRHSLR